jgi:hypothetical protein
MVPGGMDSPVVGVVFHIMGASMAAADAWFHNPSAQASAHFGIGQDGHLVQWVDTPDRAWHAAAANRHWIGVETEGSGGPLSEAGCQTFGRLYAWLAGLYGLPFAPTDDPNAGHGLGWHGMGGAAWGGHDYCPGPERKAQRAHVLQLAQGEGDDLPLPDIPDGPNGPNSYIEIYRRVRNLESWAAGPAGELVTKVELDQVNAKIDRLIAKLGA